MVIFGTMRLRSARIVRVAACAVLAAVLAAAGASAQQAGGQAIPGVDSARQWYIERIGDTHWKLTGDVEIDKDDTKIFADEVEIFTDRDLLLARGNVTVTTPTQRISADSLEFNTRTKLGTFRHASGSATLQQEAERPAEKSAFGTQEPEVLFYGETLEKIGEQKYRITNGGFTTCVQPKPRWEITSGTAILNIDHYAVLQNSVMRVKGVPLLYLPIMYYPINKEDRATGFLLPMYTSSTLKGNTISNAFFWAMSRSQDATFNYDWFSKTGHGFGTEYRYVRSRSSSGDARFYVLNERPTTAPDGSGGTIEVAGRRSFDARANLAQDLPYRLRGRLRVDYFSDITVQRTYNTNIYDASRRQRSFSGSVSGNWGPYGVAGWVDRSQYFFSSDDSTVSGALPRISVTRGEQPIGKWPVYFGVGGEYSAMVRQTVSGESTFDSGLQRIDATPTVRFPWRKYPFFTVNSSLGWRYTWWSESLAPVTGEQVPQAISRNYFDMQARIVGPVLNRIFNTPDSGYAEKIKHTIEPWVNLQRVTAIDLDNRIVRLDSTDYIVGGTTRVTYGVNNRVFAKRTGGADGGRSREILNVGIRQTYYTNSLASAVDPNYSTSFGTVLPQSLSPVSLAARFTPADDLSASFRTEYNTYVNAFMTLGAIGTYTMGNLGMVSAGWSQRRFIASLPGYEDPARSNHYLNADASLRFSQNRYGGGVSFNYDIKNAYFLQRRFLGYYNAQCCGFTVEYQTFNFGGYSFGGGYTPSVQQDRRFSFSISLAGIGSFSPPFGGMGSTGVYR
jgi:LPS-assembly protein